MLIIVSLQYYDITIEGANGFGDLIILNTENYPNSFNAFDSLGKIYESLGEKTKAIENYTKSMELNPDNEHARMRIETLN